MHPMLNIAVRAARSAGQFIARSFESDVDLDVKQKGNNDFVTQIDTEAEKIIISKIKQSYPDHSFVCEESGVIKGDDEFKWIVDPIDGTTNFVKGIPHFCVSIALMYRGRLDQAVIFDPIKNELFTASRGNGAQMNNFRLRVNQATELQNTLLATAFPLRDKSTCAAAIERFSRVFEHCGDIRRSGSAALDLAYVAAGRYDGYWEKGIKPWDIAAGELLVKEAGGLVTDCSGGHDHFQKEEVVAANPKLLKALVKTIR